MPEDDDNGDWMSVSFPAPSLRTGLMTSEDNNWESPTHTLTDTPENESYFTFKPPPKDPIVEELILGTIKRLSAGLENQPGTPDTIGSASTISTFDNCSTPSTPSTPSVPPSPDLPALEPSPSFPPLASLSQDEKDERDDLLLLQVQQQRPQLQPRTTTNRKLAMVRRHEYRGSNLRTEVRFDDDSTSFPYSLATGDFAAWRRSPTPTLWPNDDYTARLRDDPESIWIPCPKGVYCEDDDCDHSPPKAAPRKSYVPCLATQACIRMPHPPTPQELEDKKKDRFPTSDELKFYGNPCSSPVCSAPGSAYASPKITPFVTPPGSPASMPPSSRATSVHEVRVRRRGSRAPALGDIMEIDDNVSVDSNESTDSLTTHVGHQNGRQQFQLIAKLSVPFWRRKTANKALAKHALVQDNLQDTFPASRHDTMYSAAESEASNTAACESHRILVRKLNKIFWRDKAKGKKRSSRNAEGFARSDSRLSDVD